MTVRDIAYTVKDDFAFGITHVYDKFPWKGTFIVEVDFKDKAVEIYDFATEEAAWEKLYDLYYDFIREPYPND